MSKQSSLEQTDDRAIMRGWPHPKSRKLYSVGIPGELAARLEPYRDKISPTAVFQQAIEDIVTRYEEMDAPIPTGEKMAEIVERMRQEKTECATDWEKEGHQEGIRYASAAGYKRVRDALTFADRLKFAKDHDGSISWPMVMESKISDISSYFQNMVGKEVDLKKNTQGDFDECSEKWILGWCDGVIAFWESLPEDLRN